MASCAGIPIFADSYTLGVPPANVVTLSGVIGPAGPFAASFGPPRRRRPACRSPSWQAGGTGSARPGSPRTGDDAVLAPTPPPRPRQGRPAGPGPADPEAAGSGDTPPAQCGSGRRGAIRGLPPARPGLRSRGEPCTYHPGWLTAGWIKTVCCLDTLRAKWIMRKTGSWLGTYPQLSGHFRGRSRCRWRCARHGCETRHTVVRRGRAPGSPGSET